MDIKSLASITASRQSPGGAVSPAVTGSGTAASVPVGGAAGSPDVASAFQLAFTSPFTQYDSQIHLQVLEFRDTETGKVRLQVPAERVVEAYRRVATYGPAASATDDAIAGEPVKPTPPAAVTDLGSTADRGGLGPASVSGSGEVSGTAPPVDNGSSVRRGPSVAGPRYGATLSQTSAPAPIPVVAAVKAPATTTFTILA